MLPKQNRLPSALVSHVARTGKRFFTDTFSMTVLPNTLPISRFSCIVSKKTAKHAVDRNRIKRLMRESIQHLLPIIQPGFDVVIVAKTNFSDQNIGNIEPVFRDMLRQHNFLTP